MTKFTSITYCTTQAKSAYQGLFKHERGVAKSVIKDSLITSQEVGYARARAELLKGGYAERWVSIQSVFIPGLKQNDIIEFKGLNWIVKEISLNYTPPELVMTIKGLRYE